MSRKFSSDRFSRRRPSNVTVNEILCPTAFISVFASNLANPSVSPEPCSRQRDARRFVARDEKFACYARKFFRSDAASTKALCGKLHACKFIRFIRRYSATFIDALSDGILWFPSYIPRIVAAHRIRIGLQKHVMGSTINLDQRFVSDGEYNELSISSYGSIDLAGFGRVGLIPPRERERSLSSSVQIRLVVCVRAFLETRGKRRAEKRTRTRVRKTNERSLRGVLHRGEPRSSIEN